MRHPLRDVSVDPVRGFSVMAFVLFLGLFAAGPVAAQQASGGAGDQIFGSSAMESAVADHEAAADRQRGVLADLLARDEVREVARDRGIEMEKVESAASTLSDEELEELSPLLAEAAEAMRQGNTITISVYTVIIILLLLILLT